MADAMRPAATARRNSRRELHGRETEARCGRSDSDSVEELGRSVALLDKAEATVVERTEWALRSAARSWNRFRHRSRWLSASRWIKLGAHAQSGTGARLVDAQALLSFFVYLPF